MSPAKGFTFTCRPGGMLFDSTVNREDRAYLIRNLIPVSGVEGANLWEQRPPFKDRHLADLPFGGGVQLVFHFKTATSDFWFALANGKLYKDTGSAWSEVVTAANFTTASITLSTSATCYAIMYNQTVVVSDGVNVPWTWDGTTGAGGLVSLTGAPVAYGKPTEYYAKLVFIDAADRRTLQWSEENAANVGYDAAGYNNTWTLTQNDPNVLVGIQGTNGGLYYFRSTSIGLVTGAVTPDFSTTGVDDLLQGGVGLANPASVMVHGNAVYFCDVTGKPYRLRGATLEDLWRQVPDVLSDARRGFLAGERNVGITASPVGVTAYDSDRILFWNLGSGNNNQESYFAASPGCMVFSHTTGDLLAVWQPPQADAPVADATIDNVFSAVASDGNGTVYCGSDTGYVFRLLYFGTIQDVWFGVDTEFDIRIITSAVDATPETMVHLGYVDVRTRTAPGVVTPALHIQAFTSSSPDAVNGGYDLLTALDYTLQHLAGQYEDVTVGVDDEGLWARVVVTLDNAYGSQMAIESVGMRGHYVARDPAYS